MIEGRNVASTPRKLGAYSSKHAVFVVVFRSQIAYFLLSSRKFLCTRHEFDHLEQTHLLKVADVAHSFELIEMSSVVDEVEHEVVLHGHVKRLKLFSAGAAP